ncbi:MAG: decaprenyl-phosphate phosphoribosyltransferase [Planctomycetes bacterium]|nr:decaprenyl-phosphate phosphoribosyltransferase [Planctomycetota bacterium]
MPAAEGASVRSSTTLKDFADLLRPHQWVKNIIVFAGPAAGLKLGSAESILKACAAFAAFCFAASAVYAINDTIDRKADAAHPTKRHRPIARGVIAPTTAWVLAACLVAVALSVCALGVNAQVTGIVALYFATMLAYSLALKRRVLLDVIILATGFVMRAWAGAAAVGVPASEWLIACVFTLCLFFGFGKRRCELTMMGSSEAAGHHRETLVRYTPELLNHLITVSAAIAVMTFLLYTMETSRTPSAFHKENLFYTLPIVVYGIFRYAMLTELGIHTGPTEIILKDRMLLASIMIWVGIALGVAYHDPLVSWLNLPQWSWGP